MPQYLALGEAGTFMLCIPRIEQLTDTGDWEALPCFRVEGTLHFNLAHLLADDIIRIIGSRPTGKVSVWHFKVKSRSKNVLDGYYMSANEAASIVKRRKRYDHGV